MRECRTDAPLIQVGAGVERNACTHLLPRIPGGSTARLAKGTTMTVEVQSPQLVEPTGLRGQTVAVVLTWRGRIGLFKRSAGVGSDQGRWHCVTGFLDAGRSPIEQAATELHEETGLTVADLAFLNPGPVLDLPDERGGSWLVHVFRADTEQRRLQLNWEHDAYRWVLPQRLGRFDARVTWLDQVLDAR